jgi:FKBP-type peptidyl-prolyl cis-trans isomerase FkpA
MNPQSSPAPAGFWRPLALVSLVANLALAAWVWLAPAPRPAVIAPVAPSTAPAKAAPPASPAALPRELAPYAALGSFMAENNRVPDLGWNEAQFDAFLRGFRASYEGRGLPLDDEARKLRDDISRRVQAMLAQEQPDPAEDYFRMLRDKEGVLRTASGLHYRMVETGPGPHPKPSDTVVISYSARTPDGHALPQLSQARVRTVVRDLLPGLTEGVQLLQVGGKALVYVPAQLSFPESDWPPQVPAGMPLIFFLELHEIAGQR